jgi:hypothetical protein
MNYDVEIGLGSLIFIPSFINIGFAIHSYLWGVVTHTHTQQCNLLSLLSFILKEKSNLTICIK